MLSRSSTILRSHFGKRMIVREALRHPKQQQQPFQRRTMGGGGAFMHTNKFGTRLGEVFGTIAWLWVFYRFSQDGMVLLGYEHPWDHGHHGGGGHHDGHGGHGHHHKPKTAAEAAASWEAFADKAVKPGEDDDDEEEEEEEEDHDDDDDDE